MLTLTCIVALVFVCSQWGFPNPLAGRGGSGARSGSHVFNARSETVDEKRMFRDLVHKKRCVVLVDSFYEWHSEYSAQTGEVAKKQGQCSNASWLQRRGSKVKTSGGAS